MYIVLCKVFSRNSLASLLPKTDVCLEFYILVCYYLCDKIRNHWLTKQASLLYSMQNKLVACKNVHWYQFERKIKLYTTDNTSSKKYIGFNDMNCAMPSPLPNHHSFRWWWFHLWHHQIKELGKSLKSVVVVASALTGQAAATTIAAAASALLWLELPWTFPDLLLILWQATIYIHSR